MHRLARQVDLPVLGELPVQRLAQPFEDARCGPVPSRRCEERLRHCESRGLQDLVALAVSDVDDHGLEVERLVGDVTHEPHRNVSPHLVAILSEEPLLVAKVGLFPGHHLAVRFLGGRDIVSKRDVVHRHAFELVRRITQQLAVSLVDRHDLAIEARKRHAGLGLLEERPEARLTLPLCLLRAVPLGDVADQGEQAMPSLRHDAVNGNLHLQPATVLGHEAGLVADRRRIGVKPDREVGGQRLPLVLRGELDQRRERAQLVLGVAGELQVRIIAADVPAVLGDHKAFTEVADRKEKRGLPTDLHAQVAVDSAPGEKGEEAKPEKHQRPEGDRTERHHERGHRVDPERAHAGEGDRKQVSEMPRVQAELEVQKDGGEDGGRQRRQVVAEPRPSHSQDQHREDCAHNHHQQLDAEAGGQSRRADADGYDCE